MSFRRPYRKPLVRPRLERLEERLTLSVTALVDPLDPFHLNIQGNGANDTIVLSRTAGGTILLNGSPINSFGTRTVSNTDSITINGGGGNDTITIDETNGIFGPGTTNFEPGPTPAEIEINVNGGAGTNSLTVLGRPTNDVITVGALGINVNNDNDADITFLNAALTVDGGAGDDTIIGTGSSIVGPAFAGTIFGGPGKDHLTGGPLGTVEGGEGDDTLDGGHILRGGDGNDTLAPPDNTGFHIFEGGAGSDTLVGANQADTFIFGPTSSAETDTIKRFTELSKDLLDFHGLAENDPVTVDLTNADLMAFHNNRVIKYQSSSVPVNIAPFDVIGGFGDDFIKGNSADNNLDGGDSPNSTTFLGNDTLLGGPGNDILTHAFQLHGSDVFDGGDGQDTAIFANNLGFGGVISGDRDPATGELVMVDDIDQFGTKTFRYKAVELLTILPGNVVDMSGLDSAEFQALGLELITIDGASFTTANSNGFTLIGSGGPDVILGGPFNDDLEGGGGNDTLIGGPGNDRYFFKTVTGATEADVVKELANEGTDELWFNTLAANDPLNVNLTSDTALAAHTGRSVTSLSGQAVNFEGVFGGDGNDQITGNNFANRLLGGNGNNTINGSGGNDTLIGGTGNDVLNGGESDDEIQGGPGDVMNGDNGNDLFIINTEVAATDTVNGGGGNDTWFFEDASPGATGPFRFFDADLVGNQLVINQRTSQGGATKQSHVLTSIENVMVRDSALDDVIDFAALSSADLATLGFPKFTLDGNGGNDTIIGTAGDDVLIGNGDNDFLDGRDGNDTLFGDSGITFKGVTFVTPPDGNDTALGGNGNDTFDGGGGANSFDGGPGQNGTIIHGTDGNDQILIGRQVAASGPQIVVTINGHTTVEDLKNCQTIFVFAAAGNDGVRMLSSAANNWKADFHGEAGNDNLTGSNLSDRLDGGGDNDVLDGLSGDDILIGGPGRDLLRGGAGIDQFFANDGALDLIFADLADLLVSVDAKDRIFGRRH